MRELLHNCIVEKQLAEKGISRNDLGREEFLKVWEWKEQYGDKIINQLKKTWMFL